MASKKPFGSKLGGYLIEIIIIIIGISISFALSDWEQKQSAQKDYQGYLKKLQQDIRIDSFQMRNDMSSYQRKVNGVDIIFAFHEDFSRDSIALLGQAQSSLMNFIQFLPNDNTFQILSSTGDFKVFSNDSLVAELFQLYRYDYAFIDMISEEANQERNGLLKPYLIQNIYFEDKITFPQIRTNIPAVVRDRTFRNICLDYKESSESALFAYRKAFARLNRVSEMIQKELE